MKIHRFYLPEAIVSDLKRGGEVEVTDGSVSDVYVDPEEFIHQMSHVLRFRTGDVVHVFNGEVGEFKVEILASHNKGIQFKLIEQIPTPQKINKIITLGMSVIKKDNFELVVEKTTELGVSVIIPFISDRSIKKELSDTRLLRIAKEATEQSGRMDVPEIRDSTDFEKVIESAKNYDLCLFGNMKADLSFTDLSTMNDRKNILILVGPEGGWTDGEVEVMEKSGFKSISINENTLRAETAAIGLVTTVKQMY